MSKQVVILLGKIAKGDKVAFKAFYVTHSSMVYNLAISYLKNDQDAEEVTQDVFVNVFKKASTFKGASAVNTWLYRITVNASLNFLKKKKRSRMSPLENSQFQISDFLNPGVTLENKEKASILFKAIDSLGDNQKTAFILSFIEELPRQEVADIMEISLKATESLLQRAKTKLRVDLGKIYEYRRKNK